MGSTFVNYRSGYLRKSPGIRERPVPEWQCCIIYHVAARKLIRLNLNAWLIFELCSNVGFPALEEQYMATMSAKLPGSSARRQLDEGLRHLLREGLVEVVRDRTSP